MENNKILNTWRSNKIDKVYFNESDPIYVNGDYKIYRQHPECYLYVYKNIAINQLVGLNKAHLNRLAEGHRPTNNIDLFLFDRANENKQRGIELLNH